MCLDKQNYLLKDTQKLATVSLQRRTPLGATWWEC